MSSPTPTFVILSEVEPENTTLSTPVHSAAHRSATSDVESEPTKKSSEDFPVAPDIAPFEDDPYVLARRGYPISADEEPSEADSSSPSESPLPPPPPTETPPVLPSRVRRTARIRTIPVPPPHSYMLPTYVPPPVPTSTLPPHNSIPEEDLPPRKRTRPYTPPASTDFTPLSQPFELSEEARAAIARYNALRSPTPDLPTPPRVFEVGESSHAASERQPTISTLLTRIERNEEQIDTALCHLDELPLERIESMEYTSENIIDKQAAMQQELGALNTGLQQTREQVHDLAELNGQDIPLLYSNNWLISQVLMMQNDDLVWAYHKIDTLEATVMDMQAQHQENTQTLLSMIADLDSRIGGAPGSH